MSQTSTNIYDTFGNEVTLRVAQDTLAQYIENSTVNFPLPEAATQILQNLLSENETVNSDQLEQVQGRLEVSGFQTANARAMATILIKIANRQGVNPLSYFEAGDDTLKLTRDAYDAMNALRPPGNRVGLTASRVNRRSRRGALIKP